MGRDAVYHLAVARVKVGLVVYLVPDDVAPVVVGHGVLRILLLQILLYLVHRRCYGPVGGHVLQLSVHDRVEFVIAGGVGLIAYAQQGVGFFVLVQLKAHADAIGASLVLAHRVGIGYLQTALHDVERQVGTGREVYVCRIHDVDLGHWRSHLAAKLHHLVFLHHAGQTALVGLLALVGGGQRCQIAAEQRAQTVYAHVAYDDRLERRRVGKPLTIYLHDAAIVGAVYHLPCGGRRAQVVAIEHRIQSVVVNHLRTGTAVGQKRPRAVSQSFKCHRVASWGCEVEIGELQHRLQVFHRRCRRDAL